MKTTVRLTTTDMSTPVAIDHFQFGTVPAEPHTHATLVDSVAPGTREQEVFWLDRQMPVPSGQEIRFDLRFQLNVHNSASLQLCLSPGPSGTTLQWRWSAPIGFTGQWSAAEQRAPWFDDAVDYCITIRPAGDDVVVEVAEHPGGPGTQCGFIPPEHAAPQLVRPA